MTYALYRRYRPDTFDTLIGQDHVTGPLKTALAKNRVNHAYLFSGPRGCGKTTSARILARSLNCVQGPTPTPCGECPSCRDLASGGPGSIDVIEIDAASHGGVEDARELRERATFAPARDRYKIFIIDEAHMVTSAGFNALLKIVEEPPEHVKFIFATTEPDKVIGTIRSRTHHYPFRLVPPEILGKYLEQLCQQEGIVCEPGVLPLAIRAGAGSVRDTLSVLDQLMAGAEESTVTYERAVALLGYTHAALLDDVIEAFAARDSAAVFRAVDRVIQTGQDPRRFVEDLLDRFRDLIVVKAVPQEASGILRDMPADQLERLAAQAAQLGPAELSRAADVVNATMTAMTGATSPRIHLELMCARLLLPASDHTEQSLASRLERVERRLDYGQSADDAPRGSVPHAPAAGGSGAGAAARPAEPQSAGAGNGFSAADARKVLQQRAQEAAMAPAAMTPSAEPAQEQKPAPGPAAAPELAQPQAQPPSQPEPEASRPAPAQQELSASKPEQSASAQPASVQTSPAQADQAPAVQRAAVNAHTPSRPTPTHQRPSSSVDAQKTDMLRRAWPQILKVLAENRRASALIAQQGHVVEVEGENVVLGFPQAGAVQAFKGEHQQNLAYAIHLVLGPRVTVTPVFREGGGSPKAPASPAWPPSPQQGQQRQMGQRPQQEQSSQPDQSSREQRNQAQPQASEPQAFQPRNEWDAREPSPEELAEQKRAEQEAERQRQENIARERAHREKLQKERGLRAVQTGAVRVGTAQNNAAPASAAQRPSQTADPQYADVEPPSDEEMDYAPDEDPGFGESQLSEPGYEDPYAPAEMPESTAWQTAPRDAAQVFPHAAIDFDEDIPAPGEYFDASEGGASEQTSVPASTTQASAPPVSQSSQQDAAHAVSEDAAPGASEPEATDPSAAAPQRAESVIERAQRLAGKAQESGSAETWGNSWGEASVPADDPWASPSGNGEDSSAGAQASAGTQPQTAANSVDRAAQASSDNGAQSTGDSGEHPLEAAARELAEKWKAEAPAQLSPREAAARAVAAQAERDQAEAAQRAAAQPSSPTEEYASEDDEMLENSATHGRAALEKILGATLLEERVIE